MKLLLFVVAVAMVGGCAARQAKPAAQVIEQPQGPVIVRLVGQLLGESAVALLSREGLIIVGWVAMWRPLEIFLYDWWPILGDKRIRERLSRIAVRVIPGGQRNQDALARILSANGNAGVG